MPLKLSDLILAVGEENVKSQNLFSSMNSASTNKHGETKISFSTDAVTAHDLMDAAKCKLVGLVIWLPREKVEAAVAAAKEDAE